MTATKTHTTFMFFTTGSMIITTPCAIIAVPEITYMRYMSFLGLFLFKDVITRSIGLPGQLFRQKSDPGRKQKLKVQVDSKHCSERGPGMTDGASRKGL
jgi:hypothetical protein